MSKKKNKANKGKHEIKQPATLEEIKPLERIEKLVNGAPNTDSDADIQIKGNILSGLTALKAVVLPEDDKKRLDALCSELTASIQEYKDAKIKLEGQLEELEKRGNELVAKEKSIGERESRVSAQEKELDAREKSIGERESRVSDQEKELDERDADVARREVEAEAGFKAKEISWKKKATEEFRRKIESIETKLRQDREIYEQDKNELAKNQEKCRIEQGECKAKMDAIQEETDRMKREYEEAQAEIKEDYDQKMQDAEEEYKKNVERLKSKIAGLEEQVSQFNDIRAELGGRSPSEINEIIQRQVEEINQLKLERNESCSPEYLGTLKAQVESLQGERESLLYKVKNLENENLGLKAKICDVSGLRALIATHETRNEALREAQKQLRNELNVLTSKDRDREIFAEFRAIDDRCNAPYDRFTQGNGDLRKFVNDLGYLLTQYTPKLYYTPETLQLFVGGLAMSRLILLQGISGTGKTKLAQAFSSIVGDNRTGSEADSPQERCSCIVPVQAGWRDNQDLLGYYNAFEKKFYEKPFSKGLYAASTPAFKDRLFFLILDEMNLSHPEQYFADFISAMEQANSAGDSFEVELLSGISNEVMEDMNRWPQYLKNERIVVPPNVWFIGTANHDETTMEFADKTYDRAHVMIMEKNDNNVSYERASKGAAHWSASALRDAFKIAQDSEEGKQCAKSVKEKLDCLKDILKDEFDVSLGNRLERQIDDFVPVVCAAGGTEALALDHLIATKIIRRGKITGLFGVQKESLDVLRAAIRDGIGLEEDSQSIRLLDRDIKAKERGA